MSQQRIYRLHCGSYSRHATGFFIMLSYHNDKLVSPIDYRRHGLSDISRANIEKLIDYCYNGKFTCELNVHEHAKPEFDKVCVGYGVPIGLGSLASTPVTLDPYTPFVQIHVTLMPEQCNKIAVKLTTELDISDQRWRCLLNVIKLAHYNAHAMMHLNTSGEPQSIVDIMEKFARYMIMELHGRYTVEVMQ